MKIVSGRITYYSWNRFVFVCFKYALRTKIFSSVPNTTHWLDNAKGVFTETEISETKTALRAISVFVTFPIFYALYEQQVCTQSTMTGVKLYWSSEHKTSNACAFYFIGFSVDATSYIDGWPNRLLGLDNQTGPNANNYSVFGSDISHSLRLHFIPVGSNGRDSETVAKAYAERISRGHSVYFSCFASV